MLPLARIANKLVQSHRSFYITFYYTEKWWMWLSLFTLLLRWKKKSFTPNVPHTSISQTRCFINFPLRIELVIDSHLGKSSGFQEYFCGNKSQYYCSTLKSFIRIYLFVFAIMSIPVYVFVPIYSTVGQGQGILKPNLARWSGGRWEELRWSILKSGSSSTTILSSCVALLGERNM